MREQIILAPGLNGSELIKNLAVQGVNCMNVRIMNGAGLARLALMKSGVAIEEDFLSSREENTLIARAVQDVPYFGKPSYSDIQQLAAAIRHMRTFITDGEEESRIKAHLDAGIFTEKNDALFTVYKKYMELLAQAKALDNVSLMRKAIAGTKVIDADFFTMEECQLSPLDAALLDKVSNGTAGVISASRLYQTDEKPLHIASYKNCYGSPNEVETILHEIYESKKMDQCVVAVTDIQTYGQLFYDYALLYDIPVTFGAGIPIINSNPAKLMVLYYQWMTSGFFGAGALSRMLHSPAFSKGALYEQFPEKPEDFSWTTYSEVLAGLRLTNDLAVNEERIRAFKAAIAEEETLLSPEDVKAYKAFIRRKNCIPCLEIMARELALSPEDFIMKYSYIRRGSGNHAERILMQLDMAAAGTIYEELKIIRESGIEQSTDDLILNILKISVCAQSSRAGALHVTGVGSALTTLRPNVYIAGLSASKFPGAPKENYLLLDDDLRNFGPQAEYMTSQGRILRKRKSLEALVSLAANMDCQIHISYAGLNVSELKRDNASSMIFELFRKESGQNVTAKELEEHVVKIDYFAPAISVSRGVGASYNDGKIVGPEWLPQYYADLDAKAEEEEDEDDFSYEEYDAYAEEEDTEEEAAADTAKEAEGASRAKVACDLNKAYSPSALLMFFGCPRRFMLNTILGIPEPEEEKPFEVMSAMATGTLAHSLMEELANSDMTAEAFLQMAGEYFDRYIAQNPPIIRESIQSVKEQFLEMMETAYETDPHREVVLKEEDIQCMHESGVRLHGYPDRVERLEDGRYLIADFKSGRHIGHVEDDIDTCLQVVIYAYLMEQKGFDVAGGEFRYIRLGESVSCRYDDEMKALLKNKLLEFKECMETGFFPCASEIGGEDACTYCKYSSICGR